MVTSENSTVSLDVYPCRTLQRRRIKTEEKAKVVAAVWGTEFIQFLATLAIWHQDDEERIN